MALPPIDYLVIGHVTKDILPDGGYSLGGTVAYAGLTAWMFGITVGAVTSTGPDIEQPALGDLVVQRVPAAVSTTFDNAYTPTGRTQRLLGQATKLIPADIPLEWRHPRWVHLGPVADELDLEMATAFPGSFLGITPQGWLRAWDDAGRVHAAPWRPIENALRRADAVVVSLEDVNGDEAAVQTMADRCPVLVLTDGAHGARVYSRGKVGSIPAPPVVQVDPTGAGDVFAACFFILYERSGDEWEAARSAVRLATQSVTRAGLAGIPRRNEVESIQMVLHL